MEHGLLLLIYLFMHVKVPDAGILEGAALFYTTLSSNQAL